MKEFGEVLVVGMALFSMFFGSGNIIFPLWIGSETAFPTSAMYGFLITGVFFPFYGLLTSLYFDGDYHETLKACGRRFGTLLIFALLLFWIPLGSGPRNNIVAWGALDTAGINLSLPVFCALYSVFVYILCCRENKVLEILGKFITPILILTLSFMVYSLSAGYTPAPESAGFHFESFFNAFTTGFHTQDFIAAIFFSTTVISIMKERSGGSVNMGVVKKASIAAMIILSLTYVGLLYVGYLHQEILSSTPREKLLLTLGQIALHPAMQWVLFFAIFLSVLSTSIAITITFADYMRKDLFKGKMNYTTSLVITLTVSYLLSITGFNNLAVVISYGMNVLYPTLVVVTTYALFKSLYLKKKRLNEARGMSFAPHTRHEGQKRTGKVLPDSR